MFRQEYQAEMAGINAWLRRQWLRDHMRHELVPRESERDSVARLPTQRATKSIDIETFRRCYIVRGKGQVKECVLHENCPRTVGWPVPFHHPAAIWDVTCLMANRPSGERTKAPADPRIRDTSMRNTCRAATAGLSPIARRSQMVLAIARRMMPSPIPVIDTAPL